MTHLLLFCALRADAGRAALQQLPDEASEPYLLECQELDPLWNEGVGKAELLLGWQAKTVVCIKRCKVLKFLANTLQSLYVQVPSRK